MKPLISLMAMALGAALVAFIVTIQSDPLAFTMLDDHGSVATAMQHIPSVAAPARTDAPVSGAAITIEEVLLVGRWSHTPKSKQHEVSVTPAVVPAPCEDGEYRKLEPTRGVRLICPVSAALQLPASLRQTAPPEAQDNAD